ncbi:MAG: nitroreductase family protein, partial [Acidobacteriota bacterium]
APLGTDWRKPFLEYAPWLVVVFKQTQSIATGGSRLKNYYVNESVGIACGLFIASIHRMGLATLTHTPQPMRFLSRILERPGNERPYILFPVGYPAAECRVPVLSKKTLPDVTTWLEGR